MKIDWFDFWLIFSWVLLFILIITLILKFFDRLKFKKELSSIKKNNISSIILWNDNDEDLSSFKKELEFLMKDIYITKSDDKLTLDDSLIDFEESLDRLLDWKILEIIKEKENLLIQKDAIISSLEGKHQKMMKDLLNKVIFIIKEKNLLIKEKDILIENFKREIPSNLPVNLDFIKNEYVKQQNVSPNNHNTSDSDLLNVNYFLKK